jgi:threonine efflux protein
VSYLPNLLTFGAVWAVIVISPGPDLMVTMRLAMTRSRHAALAAALGISVGTAIWAAGAAMGLAVLAAQEHWITEVIRWCGATYLLVLAIQIFRNAHNPIKLEACDDLTRSSRIEINSSPEGIVEPVTSDDGNRGGCVTSLRLRRQAPGTGLLSAWRTGLFADISNPKAAIFWVSLFTTTLPKGTPSWLLVIAVILAVAIAGGWYTIVATLFSIAPILRGYQRAKRRIDFATGGILIVLAVCLLSSN